MIESEAVILDLREFATFPARKHLDGEPGRPNLGFDGASSVRSVSIDLSIQKSGEEYFCQGEVTASVELECARCLEPFTMEIKGKTDFIVCPEASVASRKQEAEDDEDYVYFQRGELRADLSGIVRQAIVLEVPIKPLCSESCRGICPQCGRNLNQGDCGCHIDDVDGRWEGLRNILS